MRTLVFILLGIISSIATAADQASSRTCRVLFLAKPDHAPKSLFLFDGMTSQEVELDSMSFSPVYQLGAGNITVALLPAPPKPAADGSTLAIPAGAPKAAVKEGVTDFYLIVSSDPANKIAPVRIQIINANGGSFRAGQMMWYNLTDCVVGGIVGSNKLRINPNSREILNAPANGSEDYPVNIQYVPPGKKRSEPLCESRWIHDPRSRSIFFVLKEPNSITPHIIGIPDYRE